MTGYSGVRKICQCFYGIRYALLCVALVLLVSAPPASAEDFIEDIELRNLQNIDAELVFDKLPTQIGDRFDSKALSEDLKKLFATEYFDDIRYEREGNKLIIVLDERPTIRRIELDEKFPIPEDELRATLSAQLIAEGEVLRRNTLSQLVASIEQLYSQNGQYGTRVSAETKKTGTKLVDIHIRVQEAPVASIAYINIIGNRVFSDDRILEEFESTARTTWNNFWSGGTNNTTAGYVRQRLKGDLGRLRDLYFNNGYIDFAIESTDVSISRDRANIYISIAVFEGEVYLINRVEFFGDLIVDQARYRQLLLASNGDVYSDSVANASKLAMEKMLGDLGYGFAEVNLDLQKNQSEKTVDVRFFVNPKSRTYVRRIIFKGNNKTADGVLRRELRQMEGGWYSNEKVLQSKSRLGRLGFFSRVDHKVVPVPGHPDQLDIEFSVEETPTGQFKGGLVYSDLTGLGIDIGISESNLFGTGNSGSVNLRTTDRRQSFSLSWGRPYITRDGVNLNSRLFYEKLDYADTEIANYATSSYGGNIGLSYPISENLSVGYNFGITVRDILVGNDPIIEISQFTDIYGKHIETFRYGLSLVWNNLNSARLPTSGTYHRGALGLYPETSSSPGAYNLSYNFKLFVPIGGNHKLVSRTSTRLGYGSALAGDDDYPFLFNFYAGGYGTVRGYLSGSLGPRATYPDGESGGTIGGNMLVQATQEIIFPLWFNSDTVRTSAFYDIGNVFTSSCSVANVEWCKEGYDGAELRSSYGVTLVWYTVVGPMIFIIPRAINARDTDSTTSFEFKIGQVF